MTVVDCGHETPCWLFKLHVGGLDGYKLFSIGKRGLLAHRHAYATLVGPIPPKLTIDHLCRQRACVRPEHLEAVTRAVNNARSWSPSAVNAQKTACDSGHPFDEDNTFWRRDGRRDCRECMRLRARAEAERARAAAKAAGVYRPPGWNGITPESLGPDFPCGHPRSSENRLKDREACRECSRISSWRRWRQARGLPVDDVPPPRARPVHTRRRSAA